jgi:uncharacterized protein (UPF0332 family)
MDKLKWCMNQKNGIKIVKPSENFCKSYMMKAKNALRSMNLNFKEGIDEWAASAAYYARYHMIYALLRRCGIKSEIHECTLEVAKFLFSEEITEGLVQEISLAKEQRIDMQYYTDRALDRKALEKNIDSAAGFVLRVKEIIDKMTSEKIETIRRKLESL